MADHEVATGVQEAAMAALEVDSMEGTATVVVDIITTAVVTAKAMAEEEAVSALEDGAVRTRDFCKSVLFFCFPTLIQVPSPIVPSC